MADERRKITKQEFCKMLLASRIKGGPVIMDVDISGMQLGRMDLSHVCMENVDLSGTYIVESQLNKMVLLDCQLSNTRIQDTQMHDCCMRNCAVNDARFNNVDMTYSSIIGCDCTATQFYGCKLHAIFINRDTILDATKFNRTSFEVPHILADLSDAVGLPALACPETGSFIAYKSAFEPRTRRPIIVKLCIPDYAKRSSAFSRKCRASEAKVLKFYTTDHSEYVPTSKIVSHHDHSFEYRLGETIQPTEPFDPNHWVECSSGIHFFMTFQEAADY